MEQLSLFKHNNLSEDGFKERLYTKSELIQLVTDAEIKRNKEWGFLIPIRQLSAMSFVLSLLDNE